MSEEVEIECLIGRDDSNDEVERIAILRDYTQGMITKWNDKFPPQLAKYSISEEEFKETIDEMNILFYEAEKYNCFICLESLLCTLSFYTLRICFSSNYYRAKRRIENYLEVQNESYRKKGVEWISPFRNGLLNVIIVGHSVD